MRFKGLSIGPGWRKHVHAWVGGVQGYTHLAEFPGPIATTACQTLHSAHTRGRHGELRNGEDPTMTSRASPESPRLVDTCHAFRETSSVVKKYPPEFHKVP